MSGFKAIGIPLICGSIAVILGCIDIWLGVISLPILYGVSDNLLSS